MLMAHAGRKKLSCKNYPNAETPPRRKQLAVASRSGWRVPEVAAEQCGFLEIVGWSSGTRPGLADSGDQARLWNLSGR